MVTPEERRHENGDRPTQSRPSHPFSRREMLRGALGAGVAASAISRSTEGSAAAPAAAVRSPRHGQEPDRARTLVVGTAGSPSDLDPHSAYEGRSEMVIYGAFEQLMRLKGDTADQYIPLLAASWEANPDKSVWTFHLREGVTFQDGSPCDAAAVKSSFERMLTLKLGPFDVIGRFVGDLAQIATPDAKTIIFNLGKPHPLFESAVAAPYGPYIVNAKLAKSHEEKGDWGHVWAQSNGAGMGTGPYEVTSFDREQQTILDKYDGYWGGWDGDRFERIVIRVVPENETLRQLIERGDIDIVDNLTPEATAALEQNPAIRVDRAYTTSDEYLIMTVSGPLASPQARQAMCWAFPYKEVVDGVYKGFAKQSRGPLAELCRGFDPSLPTYATDLDKARALLQQAGVAEGLTLSIMLTAGSEVGKAIAQLFAANLQQVGLKLEIQTVDESTLVSVAYGDAPADQRPNFFPWSWQPDYNDGWNHLSPQVACDSAFGKGANLGVYCNKQVDDLLAQAKDAADPEAYQSALSAIQKIIAVDDPAAVYTVQTQWTTVMRKEIAGFATNPIATGLYDFYRLSRRA